MGSTVDGADGADGADVAGPDWSAVVPVRARVFAFGASGSGGQLVDGAGSGVEAVPLESFAAGGDEICLFDG